MLPRPHHQTANRNAILKARDIILTLCLLYFQFHIVSSFLDSETEVTHVLNNDREVSFLPAIKFIMFLVSVLLSLIFVALNFAWLFFLSRNSVAAKVSGWLEKSARRFKDKSRLTLFYLFRSFHSNSNPSSPRTSERQQVFWAFRTFISILIAAVLWSERSRYFLS